MGTQPTATRRNVGRHSSGSRPIDQRITIDNSPTVSEEAFQRYLDDGYDIARVLERRGWGSGLEYFVLLNHNSLADRQCWLRGKTIERNHLPILDSFRASYQRAKSNDYKKKYRAKSPPTMPVRKVKQTARKSTGPSLATMRGIAMSRSMHASVIYASYQTASVTEPSKSAIKSIKDSRSVSIQVESTDLGLSHVEQAKEAKEISTQTDLTYFIWDTV